MQEETDSFVLPIQTSGCDSCINCCAQPWTNQLNRKLLPVPQWQPCIPYSPCLLLQIPLEQAFLASPTLPFYERAPAENTDAHPNPSDGVKSRFLQNRAQLHGWLFDFRILRNSFHSICSEPKTGTFRPQKIRANLRDHSIH